MELSLFVNMLFLFTSVNYIYNQNNKYNNHILVPLTGIQLYLNIFTINIGLTEFNNLCNRIIRNNQKLLESVRSFLYYLFTSILLHNSLNHNDWFLKKDLFNNIETHGFRYIEYIIYYIQISYYLNEMIDRYIYSNKIIKRKDDKEMLLHHIITLTLLLGSYYTNLIRAGLYVLYLHDINDIFLQLSKTLVYLEYKENITDITFGIFIISWIYTRLYLYTSLTLEMGNNYYGKSTLYNILFYSMSCLALLNFCWFKMILNVIYNKLVKNKLEDIRE